MERTYTVHTECPDDRSKVVVVKEQQPQVVHHVYHRRPYYYGGGLVGAMARAVTDDLYGPRYVTTSTVTTTVSKTPRTVEQTSVKVSKTPQKIVQPSVAIECFKPGFVIELRSKLSGKRLALIKDGLLNCKGHGGAACHFRIVSTGRHGVYKLQNVAQPNCYLGYVKGYIVGYGKGDNDCEFIVTTIQDHYVTLECCYHLGNVLGSLPTGDITDPSQTTKDSKVAQFAPYVIST